MNADDGLDGLVDAALDGHRVGAGGDVAQAFLIDRQGEDGGRGGAVAGDVAGFLGDGVDELGAHVLEGSARSISLLTVTPSLVTVGPPKRFLEDDVAAGRPRVMPTALASFSAPANSFLRASSV